MRESCNISNISYHRLLNLITVSLSVSLSSELTSSVATMQIFRSTLLILIIASIIYDVNSTFRSATFNKICRVGASIAASVIVGCPQLTNAALGPNDVQCQVILPASASGIYGQGTTSAIYLTAKQDVGIWQAQVRNMKPPPVLTSRTAAPFTFPLELTLNGQTDLTPEGLGLQADWQRGKVPLVVSARLDVDGVAATRNAEDLIGKAIVSKGSDGMWSGCSIELEDRGVGGRIVTKTLK